MNYNENNSFKLKIPKTIMPGKIKTLIIILLLGSLLSPGLILAGGTYKADDENVCYEGLVPCGKEVKVGGKWENGRCKETVGIDENVPCQFCHFLVMFNDGIQFLLFHIAIPASVLVLLLGAGFIFWGGVTGSAERTKTGKETLRGVAIGFTIAFSSYLIIGLFLWFIGVAEWTSLVQWYGIGSYTVECPIAIPSNAP